MLCEANSLVFLEGEKQEEQIYDENPWAQRTQQMSFKRNMHKTDGSSILFIRQSILCLFMFVLHASYRFILLEYVNSVLW